jgi:hypothetical protein
LTILGSAVRVARANSYGGLHVWGRVRQAEIYNNTVWVSAASGASPRGAIVSSESVPQSTAANVHFRNNIFVSSGAVPLVDVDGPHASSANFLFEGNIYFAATGDWSLLWAGASYARLAAWRSVANQEHVNGAAVGSAVNPLLTHAGAGPTLGDATRLETLDAYRLQAGSPAVDTALDLAAFGISPGTRDFWPTTVPQGNAAGVGAGEGLDSVAPARATSYGSTQRHAKS